MVSSQSLEPLLESVRRGTQHWWVQSHATTSLTTSGTVNKIQKHLNLLSVRITQDHILHVPCGASLQ